MLDEEVEEAIHEWLRTYVPIQWLAYLQVMVGGKFHLVITDSKRFRQLERVFAVCRFRSGHSITAVNQLLILPKGVRLWEICTEHKIYVSF
jgi:hypothetical protein